MVAVGITDINIRENVILVKLVYCNLYLVRIICKPYSSERFFYRGCHIVLLPSRLLLPILSFILVLCNIYISEQLFSILQYHFHK